jgi:hypothetical protein
MKEHEYANHTKIFFRVDESNEDVEIEGVWATPVANGYKIDNIPFCAKEIACDDVVLATPDEDGLLYFSGLASASGHSTIRLWFANEEDVNRIRNELAKMGCPSELDIPRLVAIDVPPFVPYRHIQDYLKQQEKLGIFEYEEACLGQ